MSHLVNKLVFDVKGVSKKEVTPLHNRISAFTNEQLIPALEKVFDKLVPNEETITIDKLEIDLPSLDLNSNLERQILAQINSFFDPEISHELQRQVPQLKTVYRNEEIDSSKRLFDKEISLDAFTDLVVNKSPKPSSKSYLSIKHFLETGALNWNSEKFTKESFAEAFKKYLKSPHVRNQFVSSEIVFNPEYISRILNLLSEEEFREILFEDKADNINEVAVQLINSKSEPYNTYLHAWSPSQILYFETILFSLSGKLINSFEELNNVLKTYLEETITHKSKFEPKKSTSSNELYKTIEILLEIKNRILFSTQINLDNTLKESSEILSSRNKALDNIALTENTNFESTQSKSENFQSISEFHDNTNIEQTSSKTDPIKDNSQDLAQVNIENNDETFEDIADFFSTLKKEQKKKASTVRNEEELSNTANKQSLNEFLIELGLEEKRILDESSQEEKVYYIENAGFVIAAPFLSHLFKALNLKNETGFVNDAAKLKALILSSWLCYADDDIAEYQLPLNKIICGFHPEDPVDLRVTLTEQEKNEADDMLKAVISYWSALKNTGPESFRNTFIKRKGIISQAAEGNWFLRVERGAFDVLLDTLPWPIAVHRYSWMKKLLTVEW